MSEKILFCWLGMTDLRASRGKLETGAGPIAGALEAMPFDRVMILSNSPSEEIDAYSAWLSERCSAKIAVTRGELADPMDFGAIHEIVVPVLKAARSKFGDSAKFAYHISPGTSAMAAIWILLAKTAYPAELIQSSVEGGVRTVSIPFDISAEFAPPAVVASDGDILRLSLGLPPQSPEFDAITHKCAAMRDAIVKSRLVAMHDIPVLIHGESGTGKELFARAIHASSPRKHAPFIEVNCGAIPERLFESEFFGHEKGAFTGAERTRKGYMESADGGTLFLDEIGELPLHAQVKLLRMLQERSIVRVGASKAIEVDVRIVAATNKNLAEEVAEGRFRGDLFHRLAIGVLNLPPLRERKGDLNLLIDKFLAEINCEFRGTRGGKWIDRKLSAGARAELLAHRWPGNIRELRNTISRLALWCPKATIGRSEARDAIFAVSASSEKAAGKGFDPMALDETSFNLESHLGELAVRYIEEALRRTDGNKRKAAAMLGFSNYQTMDNWLKKHAHSTCSKAARTRQF